MIFNDFKQKLFLQLIARLEMFCGGCFCYANYCSYSCSLVAKCVANLLCMVLLCGKFLCWDSNLECLN